MKPTLPATPRNRAPWAWAWAGVLLGLITIPVVLAPARWLTDAIAQASAERVQLSDARGSVWQGSAQLVLTGGAGSADAVALPGRVSWRIRPQWGGARIQINAECCTPQPLDLALSAPRQQPVQLTLADNQSQWPANLLAGLGTPWNTIRPQGQLVLSTRGLGLHWANQRMQLQGSLQLDATQMSTRLSTLVPMGSYRLTLNGGDTPVLGLSTLEGSLQLSGQGHWVGNALRFVGEAMASPGRVEALSNLLNIIGRRDGARSAIKVG